VSEAPLFISPHINRLIDLALDEDQVGFDVTSQIFFSGKTSSAYLIAKEPMVVAGLQMVAAVFARVDSSILWSPLVEDGQAINKGDLLGRLSGPTVGLLGGERTALNFLQRMCGIAGKTHSLVQALNNPKIRLADTRKTLPGYRELDKYAVRCGGGYNHRLSLAGGVMLKDNHIAAADGSIEEAVKKVREQAPHTLRVEVEVTTLDQAREAATVGAEIIMLDNMNAEQMREAIAVIREIAPKTCIEASGNVTLERLPELGKLDLDVISVGGITHTIAAADISMRFD